MSRFVWLAKYDKMLLCYSRGDSVKEIAKKFEYSVQFVYSIVRRPEFIAKLARINAEVDKRVMKEGVKGIAEEIVLKDAARKELERASLHAAQTITKLLSRRQRLDRNLIAEMRLKFEAAKDVLDRIGLKPKEVVETIERNYKPEEIESAMNTMKELTQITNNEFVFGGIRRIKREPEIEATIETPEVPVAEGTVPTV
jgi:transposase